MGIKNQGNAVQELIKTNFEFKQLHKEHEKLEVKLEEISKKKFVTAEEEKARRELQKKKLVGRDRMEEILRQHQIQT